MRLYLRSILVLVLTAWLTACGDIKIDTPTNSAVAADKPSQYHLTFLNTNNAIPTGLKISLNNQDVTALFAVTASGASATGDALASYVLSGKNVLVASAIGIPAKQAIFYYDTEGPAIHILQGSRASGHVTGYLEDPAGVKSLTIDGVSVALGAGNTFSANVQNSPFNDFVAEDSFGHQSTTSYARNDQEFVPAMSARINNRALTVLQDVLGKAVGQLDFDAYMARLNPVYHANFIGFFTVDANIKNFHFDTPTISLQLLSNNRLRAHVELPKFSFGTTLSGKTAFFIPWSAGGTMSSTNLVLDSDILASIENGKIKVNLSGTKIALNGFHLDLDKIPNILGFEDLLSTIVGGIVNIVSPIFGDILGDLLVPVVWDFIGNTFIPITVTVPGGQQLTANILPTYLQSADQALTVDLGASMTTPTPSATANPTWGSVYTEGDTPTIGATTPSGKAFDMGVSISSNLINQAMLAAHEAGITTMTIRPENVTGANATGVSVMKSKEDDVQTGDIYGLRLIPASPLAFKLIDKKGTMGSIIWNDLTVAVDLKRAAWSDYRQIFSMTINMDIPFDLGATDDGFLHIGLEQYPSITVQKVSNAGLIKLSPAFMNGMLEHFMPRILPVISTQLKSIPLTQIGSVGFYAKDFWIAGAGKNNLSIAGDLVQNTSTAAALEPKTSLSFTSAKQVITPGSTVQGNNSTGTAVTVQNGEAHIGVSGQNPNPLLGGLQYRYSVDNGPWSVWKARTRIDVTQLLAGSHSIKVCSRTVLLKQETNCPVVQFETLVTQ